MTPGRPLAFSSETAALLPSRFLLAHGHPTVSVASTTPRNNQEPSVPRSQKTPPATAQPAAPNRPLRVFRARGVRCAVFENQTTIEGRPVTFLKADLRRVYKDGEEFKTTHALSVNDVPVARLLLEQAFAFMLEATQEQAEGDGTPNG